MLPTTTQDAAPAPPAKMANGPNAFDRLLNLITTLLLTATVVILAMILIEFKRMTDKEHGLVIRGATSNNFKVSLMSGTGGLGTSYSYPIYMKAVP